MAIAKKGVRMNEKWYDKLLDDKILVILCATLLGVAAMYFFEATDSTTIVSSVVTGLFGVAIGKNL